MKAKRASQEFKVFKSAGAFTAPDLAPGCIVTIGNFDGCHIGHQSLIRSAIELANSSNSTSKNTAVAAVALSFSPRPEAFFHGVKNERLLFTENQKTRAFAELGLNAQIIQTFDEPFSRLSHEDFYQKFLLQGIKARGILVGENFRFGHDRLGDTEFLKKKAKTSQTKIIIGQASLDSGKIVSSTRIRAALSQSGNVKHAEKMLGRPYMLEGVIKKGDQLGRQLGVPTANLEDVRQIIPAFGVYAGYVVLNKGEQNNISVTSLPKAAVPAVFSIGVRPTLARLEPVVRIEAHLLHGAYGANELYDYKAGFFFQHRLRGEEHFANLEQLKKQMQEDIKIARHLL
jgi:riboflavin kinase/FMN adenylyltransferase